MELSICVLYSLFLIHKPILLCFRARKFAEIALRCSRGIKSPKWKSGGASNFKAQISRRARNAWRFAWGVTRGISPRHGLAFSAVRFIFIEVSVNGLCRNGLLVIYNIAFNDFLGVLMVVLLRIRNILCTASCAYSRFLLE
jgi:hypothetical protein